MRLTLTLILIGTFLLSNAQQQKLIYLDDNGKSVSEKKAVTLEQHLKINDTLYEVNTYTVDGPRSTSIQYSDPKGETLNGRYITYDRKGYGLTVGTYSHGLKEGNWFVLTSKSRVLRTEIYHNGKLIQKIDSSEANEDKNISDTTGTRFTKIEVESEFPGGASAWLQYLGANLRYPQHAVDKDIQGSPIVTFIVEKDGKVLPEYIYLERSVEYTLDAEALKAIRNTPDWTPATQNGRKVRSWKKQPIVFSLTPEPKKKS
ncbi:MAG: energy transducer TonB [Bacteroidetes bacterium]|nr:energy transducer TonB [Bacteroidota bacterium]